ncbi:MAG: hypothetical protein H6737_11490 [Alphaproteobacteria bacterium]|nr:hypothetical protein [Alphaproteobacteria bacterium]
MIWMIASLALAQDTPAPAPAPADEQLEEAKRLYENGVRLYEEALYDEAIVAFEESYALSRQHALLFNIANAQERKGDLEAAIKTLNKYRIYAEADEAAKLDRRVRTLEERLDKQRVATAPAPVPTPTPTPAPQPVQTTRTVGNPAKWALLGGGIGTSVVFGSLAAWSYTEGQAAIDAGNRDLYSGPKTLNNVSLGLTVAGLGLAAVGVALPAKREITTVSLAVTPSDAHVRASWRF